MIRKIEETLCKKIAKLPIPFLAKMALGVLLGATEAIVEAIGISLFIDDCKCFIKNKYLKILSILKN